MTDELRHTDEIPSRASEFVADLNVHASGAWAIVALDTAFRTGMLAQLSVPRRIDDVARRTGAHPELVRGVADVLVSLGALEVREDGVVWAPWIRETDDAWRDSVAAKVRSVCLQTDAFRSDPRLTDQQDDSAPRWEHSNPGLLEAQGRQGADTFVQVFEKYVLPYMGGLGEHLNGSRSRFLDIGAGTGSLTLAVAERWPLVTVDGIEPWGPSLVRARRRVRSREAGRRIRLLPQRAEHISEEDAYDLVWLPYHFLSRTSVRRTVERLYPAIRPGGWLWAAGTVGGQDLQAATGRMRSVWWGGSGFKEEQMIALIESAGFVDVRAVPRLPGAEYAHIVGRRAAVDASTRITG